MSVLVLVSLFCVVTNQSHLGGENINCGISSIHWPVGVSVGFILFFF